VYSGKPVWLARPVSTVKDDMGWAPDGRHTNAQQRDEASPRLADLSDLEDLSDMADLSDLAGLSDQAANAATFGTSIQASLRRS